jgi:FtsP/CotA-like multicopper oxidase with cupredoxin domain
MQSRKTAAIAGVVVLIAAIVVFIVLQGGSGSDSGPSSKTFDFQLANGKPVADTQDVSATQGDHVTVTLKTDVPAELHVHGYEKSTDVDPGKTGSVSFVADATGEFEIEAHHLAHGDEGPGEELATLEVNP